MENELKIELKMEMESDQMEKIFDLLEEMEVYKSRGENNIRQNIPKGVLTISTINK